MDLRVRARKSGMFFVVVLKCLHLIGWRNGYGYLAHVENRSLGVFPTRLGVRMLIRNRVTNGRGSQVQVLIASSFSTE